MLQVKANTVREEKAPGKSGVDASKLRISGAAHRSPDLAPCCHLQGVWHSFLPKPHFEGGVSPGRRVGGRDGNVSWPHPIINVL